MNITSIKSLLGFARSIGYKNLSEIQTLKKAVKAGKTAGTCHLETDNKVQEFIQRFAKSTNDNKSTAMINFTRGYFPQAYAPDVKNVLDIAYKRLGQKSGIVEMTAKSVNSAGNELSSGSLKVLANSSGGRVKLSIGSNFDYAGRYDISVVPSAFNKESSLNLLKGMKYNEANGISHISLPQTQVRGLKADVSLYMPTPYVNNVTGILSDYQYVNFGQLLSKLA